MLSRNYGSRILWFFRSGFRPFISHDSYEGEYAEDFMKDFCEAEDMGYVERTKIVVEVVVNESIVDGKEGGPSSGFG